MFAYIDPGTGSLFFQALIGVILGGFVIFRNYFFKAVAKIKSIFARPTTADDKEK